MNELRKALLELHRAIVAVEREDYERKAGAVNAGQFLRLLIEDDAWSWLRPLSELIVLLDAPDDEKPEKALVVSETRKLLKPDSAGTPFQQHYAWLMDRSPEVTFAHGAVIKALRDSA